MADQQDGWVGDVYRPKEQRAALLAFADAIGAKRRLGADEAGNPRIEGRHGAIYVQPKTCDPGQSPKFQIYFTGHPMGWKYAREALSAFAKVTNNAHDEGLLLIERLPTASEGEIIRDKLTIFKRVVYSDEVLAAKRDHMARLRATADNAGGLKNPYGERGAETGGVETAEKVEPALLSG